MCIFTLGTYQVQRRLGLFAKRYGTPDWGQTYLGYMGWLAVVLLAGKLGLRWSKRQRKW